jgi:hypothetical protein
VVNERGYVGNRQGERKSERGTDAERRLARSVRHLINQFLADGEAKTRTANRRLIDESACANSLNSLSIWSGAMPMPVSLTEHSIVA